VYAQYPPFEAQDLLLQAVCGFSIVVGSALLDVKRGYSVRVPRKAVNFYMTWIYAAELGVSGVAWHFLAP